jgi:hypothetical protein
MANEVNPWWRLDQKRPPCGLFVQVGMDSSGVVIMTAKRKLVPYRDYQGREFLVWHDGAYSEHTACWNRWREIPGEQMDVGPGFC